MYDVVSSISVEQKFLWVLIYADNNKIKFSLKLKYMHAKKIVLGRVIVHKVLHLWISSNPWTFISHNP